MRSWIGSPSLAATDDDISGCPAVARPVHDVVVIASRVERVPLVGPRALAIHRDIVTAAMDAPALLPLPFGTLIADDQVERWLEARWETVEATLERVRGRVEMSVKLLRLDGREPHGTASPPGSDTGRRRGHATARWATG